MEVDGKLKIDYILNVVDEEIILEGIEKGLCVFIVVGVIEIGIY